MRANATEYLEVVSEEAVLLIQLLEGGGQIPDVDGKPAPVRSENRSAENQPFFETAIS